MSALRRAPTVPSAPSSTGTGAWPRSIGVLCKGEGACVPVCPKQAVSVQGYTNEQITAMIDALAKEAA